MNNRERGAMTRRTYVTLSHCCWAVMADSRVVGQDGSLLCGVNAVLSNAVNLPVGVEIVRDESQQMVMMCLTGIEHFRRGVYKCVSF